jgi:hypothetical protein
MFSVPASFIAAVAAVFQLANAIVHARDLLARNAHFSQQCPDQAVEARYDRVQQAFRIWRVPSRMYRAGRRCD